MLETSQCKPSSSRSQLFSTVLNFVLFALSKGIMFKTVFKSDHGKTFFSSAVVFAFARPPLNLHVPEVPKDSQRKVTETSGTCKFNGGRVNAKRMAEI